MSHVKQFIKNISPLNNRSGMPAILYIIKVVIVFWTVKFASELIGEGVVMGIHFAFGKNPLQGEMFSENTMMLIMYFGYALMIGIMILYWKLFQKRSIAKLGFTKQVGTYLIGAVLGTVLVAISAASVILTGTLNYHGVFSCIDSKFIILMLGGFVFQGGMEEVLCRGFVLQLLKDKVSIPVAICVSTVLFIIPHLSSMQGASAGIIIFAIVDLILISIIFSLLTIRFNSIWAACGLHSIWNFILYNILGLNLSGNDTKTAAIFDIRSSGSNVLNGGMYGIEASAVTAVVLAVAVIALLVSFRKEQALSSKIVPAESDIMGADHKKRGSI
ncbi:MAG: CPBP family intramembrane metalloprotease [Clostridiales bacterium]|nr:CPBP family intramembrane metalloprotease [Clostridiales bacterium]